MFLVTPVGPPPAWHSPAAVHPITKGDSLEANTALSYCVRRDVWDRHGRYYGHCLDRYAGFFRCGRSGEHGLNVAKRSVHRYHN